MSSFYPSPDLAMEALHSLDGAIRNAQHQRQTNLDPVPIYDSSAEAFFYLMRASELAEAQGNPEDILAAIQHRSDELMSCVSDLLQANGADYFWKNLMFLVHRTALRSSRAPPSSSSSTPLGPPADHQALQQALAEKDFEIAALREEARQAQERARRSEQLAASASAARPQSPSYPHSHAPPAPLHVIPSLHPPSPRPEAEDRDLSVLQDKLTEQSKVICLLMDQMEESSRTFSEAVSERHKLSQEVDVLKRGFEDQAVVIERLMDLNAELAEVLNARAHTAAVVAGEVSVLPPPLPPAPKAPEPKKNLADAFANFLEGDEEDDFLMLGRPAPAPASAPDLASAHRQPSVAPAHPPAHPQPHPQPHHPAPAPPPPSSSSHPHPSSLQGRPHPQPLAVPPPPEDLGRPTPLEGSGAPHPDDGRGAGSLFWKVVRHVAGTENFNPHDAAVAAHAAQAHKPPTAPAPAPVPPQPQPQPPKSLVPAGPAPSSGAPLNVFVPRPASVSPPGPQPIALMTPVSAAPLNLVQTASGPVLTVPKPAVSASGSAAGGQPWWANPELSYTANGTGTGPAATANGGSGNRL